MRVACSVPCLWKALAGTQTKLIRWGKDVCMTSVKATSGFEVCRSSHKFHESKLSFFSVSFLFLICHGPKYSWAPGIKLDKEGKGIIKLSLLLLLHVLHFLSISVTPHNSLPQQLVVELPMGMCCYKAALLIPLVL